MYQKKNSRAHFATDGRVWSQALSSQDVSMNNIFHKGEIYQIGPVTEVNKQQIKNSAFQEEMQICKADWVVASFVLGTMIIIGEEVSHVHRWGKNKFV